MNDASGSTSWTYDSRDRVKTKATPQGTLTYTYHANGLVASVVSSNANGVNIGYAYDTLNRLQSVTDNRLAPNGTTTYTWDDVGNPLTMTYPNGVVHTFGTDVMERISSVAVTKSGTTLSSQNYTFGFAGNKLTEINNNGRSVSWAYDASYRLTTETVTGDPMPALNGVIGYGLDAVGNRLSRTSTIAAIPATANTYDVNDRISGDTFDANGNTLTSGGHTYGYDFLDRLTSYDGAALTMVHDGYGNRVSKTVGGVTTKYLVDELTPTGYSQVAEELVGGSVARRYAHGAFRHSQTQLISGAWTTHYYGYDGGLHVTRLTDSTGAVSDTYTYDAYGNLTAASGSTPNVYLYRGEQYDSSVQMYYLRARWYAPGNGRFFTSDPIERAVGDQRSRTHYSYCEADPVNHEDPSGLDSALARALRSLELRVARFGAEVTSKWAVRPLACVAAKAALLGAVAAIVRHETPFISGYDAQFFNIAVADAAEAIGSATVNGPLPRAIVVYIARSVSPATEASIRVALNTLAIPGRVLVDVTRDMHAEVRAFNMVKGQGHMVGGLVTLYRLCPGCARLFAYTGDVIIRGTGHCIVEAPVPTIPAP
ncbi:MAG: RHS repeat-associated core domain-containing protein [Bryobacterales bacterium]|nr:RHS repeat-associated core domain-containing protein [Bryobacterales bacterium]